MVTGSMIPGIKISATGCWARGYSQICPSVLAGREVCLSNLLRRQHWFCVSPLTSSAAALPDARGSLERAQDGWDGHTICSGEVQATQSYWHCWKAEL